MHALPISEHAARWLMFTGAFWLGVLAGRSPTFAAPEYWVDNEWIRVTAEERRKAASSDVLALVAVCKQQGFPEYIITHLDASGAAIRTEKSGKYCPREGEAITFLLPLPASGSYRIEFNRIEGAM